MFDTHSGRFQGHEIEDPDITFVRRPGNFRGVMVEDYLSIRVRRREVMVDRRDSAYRVEDILGVISQRNRLQGIMRG